MNILRYSPDVEESQLRQAIVETGRIGYAKGFLAANNGNISGRLTDGTIVISPSGLCKGRMSEDDLFRLQPDGTVVASPPDESLSVSSETPMHLAALRIRPDRQACLHAHPTLHSTQRGRQAAPTADGSRSGGGARQHSDQRFWSSLIG